MYLLRVSRNARNCVYPSRLAGLIGPTLSYLMTSAYFAVRLFWVCRCSGGRVWL